MQDNNDLTTTPEEGDISPAQSAAQQRITDAYAAGDYEGVVAALGDSACGDTFTALLLTNACMKDAALPVTRHILDHRTLSELQAVMMIDQALLKGQMQTAHFLISQCDKWDLSPVDAYARLLARVPQDRHPTEVTKLLDAATDRVAALDDLFCAALLEKKYAVAKTALDLGADPNVMDGQALLTIVTNYELKYYEDEEKYNALLDTLFNKGYRDPAVVDKALVAAMDSYCIFEQRMATVMRLLLKDADTWQGMERAVTLFKEHLEKNKKTDELAIWIEVINYVRTAEQTAALETLTQNGVHGKKDIGTLLNLKTQDGDTGLMLAAKAGVFDSIAIEGLLESGYRLTVAEITAVNIRDQSLLSLLADRGLANQLMRPEILQDSGAGLMQAAQKRLTPAQMDQEGFKGFAAALNGHTLKQKIPHHRYRL